MRLTTEVLASYMEHWEAHTRRAIQEQLAHDPPRATLAHFSEEEADLLRALLARLLPQPEGEAVDLVGFLDWAVDKPLVPGLHRAGLPPSQELIRAGLLGVQEAALLHYGRNFVDLEEAQQDALVTAMQEGVAPGQIWRQIPSREFFVHLLMKALAGYLAHPLAWRWLGFPEAPAAGAYAWLPLRGKGPGVRG